MLRVRVFGETDLTRDSEKSDVPSGPKPREVTRKGRHGFSNTEISLSAERPDATHFPSTLGMPHMYPVLFGCCISPEVHGRKKQSILEPEGAPLSQGKEMQKQDTTTGSYIGVYRRCWTQRGRGTRT